MTAELAAVDRQARESEVADINPLYLELAFRAAELRGRSDAQRASDGAGAVLAPGEIDPGLRRDRPLMERQHATPMGSHALPAIAEAKMLRLRAGRHH